MDGKGEHTGEYKGPRTVTTRKNNGDYVKPNGADFENGTPKNQRKEGGHIHGQTK